MSKTILKERITSIIGNEVDNDAIKYAISNLNNIERYLYFNDVGSTEDKNKIRYKIDKFKKEYYMKQIKLLNKK